MTLHPNGLEQPTDDKFIKQQSVQCLFALNTLIVVILRLQEGKPVPSLTPLHCDSC